MPSLPRVPPVAARAPPPRISRTNPCSAPARPRLGARSIATPRPPAGTARGTPRRRPLPAPPRTLAAVIELPRGPVAAVIELPRGPVAAVIELPPRAVTAVIEPPDGPVATVVGSPDGPVATVVEPAPRPVSPGGALSWPAPAGPAGTGLPRAGLIGQPVLGLHQVGHPVEQRYPLGGRTGDLAHHR